MQSFYFRYLLLNVENIKILSFLFVYNKFRCKNLNDFQTLIHIKPYFY